MSQTSDILIIGGGIVGLSVARTLLAKNPALSITILEKEPALGKHASGRNSGVMHCGIFYGSDTLKAKVCARGAAAIGAFAREHGIAHQVGGKLIVATEARQMPSVEKLLKNAADNGIRARLVSAEEARDIEPFAAPAHAAIHCPDTAVIDSKAVLAVLERELTARGVRFVFHCTVEGPGPGKNTLATSQGVFGYGYLFNCAGAYADRIAKTFGLAGDYILAPFKGLYWKLSAAANPRVRANIYPVPDPALPFLGVHLTRVISGDVYVGPTAIPALGRENYSGLEGIHPGEALTIFRLLSEMYLRNQQNFRTLTHHELRKYSKRPFFESARRLMPSLTMEEMERSPKVGIRPQLVNIRKKQLEMDYIFEHTEHSLHVLNTISPAFTSSFAFAEMIVEQSRVA